MTYFWECDYGDGDSRSNEERDEVLHLNFIGRRGVRHK